MPRMTLFACSLFVGLFTIGEGAGGLRGTPAVNVADIEASLISELIGSVAGHVHSEEALRPTYESLPKNEYGNLDHQAVRYVLHRFFVKQHGWFIKGLEPNGDTFHTATSSEVLNEAWVPSYLQGLLEKRMESARGFNLRELAALAGTLEDIIRKNSGRRLEVVYKALGYATVDQINNQDMQEILATYMVDFLDGGNFSAGTPEQAKALKDQFMEDYTGWPEVEQWLRDIELEHISRFKKKWLDFDGTKKIVEEIGEKFGHFNDLECQSLKTMLIEMESAKAGRVRLSDFYNKSMYSHWELSEKGEYLRALGALDESEANRPLVIIANYVGARQNCLEVSPIYAVCCRNECEDLMGQLERDIGESSGEPSQIAKVVGGLKTDTIHEAPRTLPDKLIERLQEVATRHGGKVPLHGRLFAQWMHHAFPRECPFPHEAGTTTPMTPDQWIKETGDDNCKASESEMLSHVVPDVVAKDFDSELPWTQAEELLAPAAQAATTANSRIPRAVAIGFTVFGILILTLLPLVAAQYGTTNLDEIDAVKAELARKKSIKLPGVIIAFGSLTTISLATDLLDAKVVGCVLACGLFMLAIVRCLSMRAPDVKKF